MSQAAVMTVVERKCRAIPYVVAVQPYGVPDGGMPNSDIPGFVLDLIDSTPKVVTLGRTVEHMYEIRMTLYLGQPGMASTEAKRRLRDGGYDDAVIAAFKDDWTLLDLEDQPTCHNCDITEGADNLQSFRDEGAAPKRQWRLFVTEYV